MARRQMRAAKRMTNCGAGWWWHVCIRVCKKTSSLSRVWKLAVSLSLSHFCLCLFHPFLCLRHSLLCLSDRGFSLCPPLFFLTSETVFHNSNQILSVSACIISHEGNKIINYSKQLSHQHNTISPPHHHNHRTQPHHTPHHPSTTTRVKVAQSLSAHIHRTRLHIPLTQLPAL